MNHKELSNTGIKLPEIALGTWKYKGGVEPLRAGIALGAYFIDTAEAYGTEEVVGRAIKGMRDRVFVATKILPRHFRRFEVIRSAEASLKRLNTHYIDLYQLHYPNYTVPIGETIAAMEELVEMGKVRFIGVSNFSAAELREAQTALAKNPIVSNQVRYSVVDRTVEPELLPFCTAKQITVLAFSPLGHGLQSVQRYDRRDVLGQIAAETGRTRAQVALNWCISRKPVIAIFKSDQVEHVAENCAASGSEIQPAHLKALDQQVSFEQHGRLALFVRRVTRHTLQRFGRMI